jgi:hypothetical protein
MRAALMLLVCGMGLANPVGAAPRSVSHTLWVIAPEQVTVRVVLPVEAAKYTVAPGQPLPSNEYLAAYLLQHLGVARQGSACEAIDQGYDIGRVNTLAAGQGLRSFEIIFHCPGSGRAILNNSLLFDRMPQHVDYARIEESGASTSQLFTAQRRQLDLAVHDASAGADTYLGLGANHIAHSLQRICFFLGLLLLARLGRDWLIAATGLVLGYCVSMAIPLLHLAPNMQSVDSTLGLLVALCALQWMAMHEKSPGRVALIVAATLTLLGAAAWRLNTEVAWVLIGAGVFSGSLLIVAPRGPAWLVGVLPFTFGMLDGVVFWGDFSRLHLWRAVSSSTLLFLNLGSLLAGLGIVAVLYAATVGRRRIRRAAAFDGITTDLVATALAGLGAFWVLAQLKN